MKPSLSPPLGAVKLNPPDLSGYWANYKLVLSAHKNRKPARRSEPQLGQIGIPSGGIDVDAPDLPQPTAYSCALAAASLARLYGVGPDNVDEFLQGMLTKRGGTNPSGIVRFLNKIGLKARIKRNMTSDMLKDLLDDEISTILAIQAWASNPADYDDPNNCDNGHYAAVIGYAGGQPQVKLASEKWSVSLRPRNPSNSLVPTLNRIAEKAVHSRRRSRSAAPAISEEVFYFMDPSILCRYGYMTWSNLDRRWHDNEGNRTHSKVTRHMGIIVDPNGHAPVHDSVADEML